MKKYIAYRMNKVIKAGAKPYLERGIRVWDLFFFFFFWGGGGGGTHIFARFARGPKHKSMPESPPTRKISLSGRAGIRAPFLPARSKYCKWLYSSIGVGVHELRNITSDKIFNKKKEEEEEKKVFARILSEYRPKFARIW